MSKIFILPILTAFVIFLQTAAPDTALTGSYAQEAEHNESADGEHAPTGKGEASSVLPTVHIGALNFSIIRKGRVRGTVSIVPALVIQNPDSDEREKLEKLATLIRTDLMATASLLSQRRFRVNRPIDPDYVARHFQNKIDQRIGAGKIIVYILDASIRPVR